MLIYWAVQLHHFELRWRWVVSSLLQQALPRRVAIAVDCAVLEGDDNPFRFPAERARFLTYHETPRKVFARRGLVRNQQVERAVEMGADWIYFGDADHLYPPEYVGAIAKLCRSRRFRTCDRVLFDWSKLTTEQEATDRAVRLRLLESRIVLDAYDRASQLPRISKAPNMNAGGAMQLGRVAAIVEKNGGRYVHPKYRRPWDHDLFGHGQRARSDWQFRATMGQRRITLDSRPPIHLNHKRDKEAGYHLEEQR